MFASNSLWAAREKKSTYIVEKIVNDKEVVIRPIYSNSQEMERIHVGSIFAVHAISDDTVIAFATVIKKSSENWVLCHIDIENKHYFVRENAKARLVRFDEENDEFAGNYTLLRSKDSKVQARYQPLTYLGHWSGQTAATLREKEWLLGPSMISYGVIDRFQVFTTPFQNFVSIYNVGTNVQLIPEDDYTFSLGLHYSHYANKTEANPLDVSLMFDTYASSKIMSYTKLTFFGERPDSDSYFSGTSERSDNEKKRDYSVELQNYYGIMLSNWNRLLVGPKYNFDERLLGGHISYAFVGKNAHFMVGVMTEDFSEPDIGSKGYRAIFDFYWRY